jgi:asparagine synthase (glutamine-hydrolysing)
MCGLAGRVGRQAREDGWLRGLGECMCRAMERRGPDASHTFVDRELMLTHARLAIIDLSPAGAQPLWNEDGTIAVIVNGEIYNHRTLRRELLARGHRFRSHSDSEPIVHLYEDLGIDACCQALEGMFAFALWDARSRDLYLVRDRLGIKPLVFAEHRDGVTFASTLSAVLVDPFVARDLRPESLLSVITWGFVPTATSAIRACRHAPPGSLIHVREGRIVHERPWWVDEPPTFTASDEDVRSALGDAVESHLVADVPVGLLLSAGIDSGLVTALAVRNGQGELAAWTVSHRGCPEDEFVEASQVAQHHDIRLQEIPLGRSALTWDRFERMVEFMDEPLVDASLIGLHDLYMGLSRARRVALSGDGGDELFAGYGWHIGLPERPQWADQWWFNILLRPLALLPPLSGKLGTLGAVARERRRHPAVVYADKYRPTDPAILEMSGLPSMTDDPLLTTAANAWDRFASRGTLEQMLAVDRAVLLVDRMLAKLDTASMAHSVEARVPMLGDRVVEAAKALPSARKRVGPVGKVCLRDWMAEIGPPGFADRRKTGFDSPLSEWLKQPIGNNLRELAAEGAKLVDARRVPSEPGLIFAFAVVAAWESRARSRMRAAA